MIAVAPPATHMTWKGAAGLCALWVLSGSAPPCPEPGCSCLAVQELPQALSGAEAVFAGTVRSVTERPRELREAGEEALYERIVRIEVIGKWKGSVPEVIEVSTGLSDADCGYPFRSGESYLIFAYGEADRLGTSLCTRTALLEGAVEDILALGPLREADP